MSNSISLEEAYVKFFTRIVDDAPDYSTQALTDDKSASEQAALVEVRKFRDSVRAYTGVQELQRIFNKLRTTSLPIEYTLTKEGVSEKRTGFTQAFRGNKMWPLIDGKPDQNLTSSSPEEPRRLSDVRIVFPPPSKRVDLTNWREGLKLSRTPINDKNHWVDLINTIVERVVLNIEDLASAQLATARKQRTENRMMFSTGGQFYGQMRDVMNEIETDLNRFFEQKTRARLRALEDSTPKLLNAYSKSFQQSIATGIQGSNYHKNKLLQNGGVGVGIVQARKKAVKNALNVLTKVNVTSAEILQSKDIQYLTKIKAISRIPNASVGKAKFNAAVSKAKKQLTTQQKLYNRALSGALDPSKAKQELRHAETASQRIKAQLAVQMERFARKSDHSKLRKQGVKYGAYNNSKRKKGMIFFKLRIKANKRNSALYDYWYVKIEDSCAALSTAADLFDTEQVVHAGGAITKILLSQGKIPSAFARREKVSRNDTLQLINREYPGHTYGLVGKQVNDYDTVVDRKLKNSKRGSEIVVRPEDVPSTPADLRSKLQDIRRDLRLKHGGVFILPVTPGGPADDMIMKLHEQGLGRASSHQKLFPGAGEARIMCLNDRGFSPPNMYGRKFIKPSLARREEMIRRVQNSMPEVIKSSLNSRARRRVAEQAVKGRGYLGIAPSKAQTRGLMKGIGLVWLPILVVCITGFFTGVQTARGVDRSAISLSWWGLGVSAALHLFFSGNNALKRERDFSFSGARQDKDARKRMFDVTQKKANSRFVLTMGVMCVFLGALRAGHGPLSGPTRVVGVVLAVASVLGFVLFLREGLSVPKFKHTSTSVRQEMDYERRKKAIPKLRAAQNQQANRIRMTAARSIQKRFRERRARAQAAEQAAKNAAKKAEEAAAKKAAKNAAEEAAKAAAKKSNKFKITLTSGSTTEFSWPELTSVHVSGSQYGGNAERIKRKTNLLSALGLNRNANKRQIRERLIKRFPNREAFIEQLT